MSKDMLTCHVCGWHDHWQRFDGGHCPNCGAFVTDEDDTDADAAKGAGR